METRALRRHGIFALTLILLFVAGVGVVRDGTDVSSQNFIGVMGLGALVVGLLGSFYVPQKWRRVFEVIGVSLALVAVVLLFTARA